MNDRLKRLAKIYLPLFIVPGVFFFLAHIVARPDYISLGTAIAAGMVNLLGPWATLAARWTDIPNAGEFFRPWIAGGLTVTLLAVIIAAVRVTKKWPSILCATIFAIVIIAWLLVGFFQIASCII